MSVLTLSNCELFLVILVSYSLQFLWLPDRAWQLCLRKSHFGLCTLSSSEGFESCRDYSAWTQPSLLLAMDVIFWSHNIPISQRHCIPISHWQNRPKSQRQTSPFFRDTKAQSPVDKMSPSSRDTIVQSPKVIKTQYPKDALPQSPKIGHLSILGNISSLVQFWPPSDSSFLYGSGDQI